jgi:hypothetical protein
MRTLGFVIVLAGVAGLLVALSMDTSVASGMGRVNNFGLMKDQQNYVIVTALMVGVGTVIMVASMSRRSLDLASQTVSADATKTCPECAEVIKRGAKVCRFCGNRQFGPEISERLSTTAARTGNLHAGVTKESWWDKVPAGLAVLMALSTAALAAVWFLGDNIDASGKGTYTAKDVLVDAWLQISGSKSDGADATGPASDTTLPMRSAATGDPSHRTDIRQWPSAKHRKLSQPDTNGCIKELAEEAGLHCEPVT